MDLIKKYNAQIETMISGTAGPVIKAIGSKIIRNEKKISPMELFLSKISLLNGEIKKLINIISSTYIN